MMNLVEHIFSTNFEHFEEIEPNVFLLKPVALAFKDLQQKALCRGFHLKIASAYRSYRRQKQIWEEKITGIRPLLDWNERPIDPRSLNHKELIETLLRWSAIPGLSRHHWGTDLDVFDTNAHPKGQDYKVQLTLQETQESGPYHALHNWLTQQIDEGQSCGFYRPYRFDHGGVSPEPWHLSYAPLAREFENKLDYELFIQILSHGDFLLRDELLQLSYDIFERFILPADDVPINVAQSLHSQVQPPLTIKESKE